MGSSPTSCTYDEFLLSYSFLKNECCLIDKKTKRICRSSSIALEYRIHKPVVASSSLVYGTNSPIAQKRRAIVLHAIGFRFESEWGYT